MDEDKGEDIRMKLREKLRKQREQRQRGQAPNVGKSGNLEARAEQALSAKGLDPTMLVQWKHQMFSSMNKMKETVDEEEEEAPPPSVG